MEIPEIIKVTTISVDKVIIALAGHTFSESNDKGANVKMYYSCVVLT